MAEQIDVPGVGRVNQQYVMVGGAAVAGFVAYAYYRRRQANALPVAVPVVDPSSIPATDYTPPATSGNASGSQDLTAPGPPRTNAEWTRAATEYLGNIGFDPAMVARALGAYMTRQGLDPTSMDAVRAAVGAFGEPPVGGPWAIMPKQSEPPPGPPPPGPPPPPPPPPPPGPPEERGYYFHPHASPAPLSTLWGMAAAQYGDGSQWTRIWNHPKNAGNRAYSRNDPNLIYTGQNWWIPL